MTTVMEQRRVEPVPGRPRVGKVHAELVVRNDVDEVAVLLGVLDAAAVRELRLEQVLADTGADLLCLPRDMVEALGLPVLREVAVDTANGTAMVTLHDRARVTLMGQTVTTRVLALPAGSRPLLGVVLLEMLGIELDLKNQVMRVLPTETGNTYLTL